MKREMMDLVGQKYNKLTVLKEVPRKNKSRRWLCLCDCGNTKEVDHGSLRTAKGAVKSCGCEHHPKKWSTKSNIHRRRLLKVWQSMLDRCYKPHAHNYYLYGDRGIKVSKSWHDFGVFYNDVIDTYKLGLSLDRINNDGDYSLQNCRWATLQEQANNKRDTIYLTYKNETKSLQEWARYLNVRPGLLSLRYFRKWTDEQIIEGRK